MVSTTESSSEGSAAKGKQTSFESVADKSGKTLAIPAANKAPRVMNFLKPNQDFVNIVVGKEDVKQTFRVHKDLICQLSPYFKAAFDGPFEEGRTQTMRMEDVDTDLFGILVNWLYTKEIPSDRSFVTSRIHVNDGTAGKFRFDFRHDSDTADSSMVLPTLQEEKNRKELKDLLLRAEIWKSNYSDVAPLADYCYSTANQTPLKRLAIQVLASGVKSPGFNLNGNEPKATILDVTRHLAMRIPVSALAISKVEDFYVEEPKEK